MGLGRGPVSSSPTLGRVCCQQVAKASTGLPTPTLRLRLAGGSDLQAPLPQLRKERQSPPWQKCENPEIKKPRRTRPLRNRGSLCSDLPACRRICPSARGTPALTAEKSPQSLRLAWCGGLRQEDLGVSLQWSRGLSHTASATRTWVERFCSFE